MFAHRGECLPATVALVVVGRQNQSSSATLQHSDNIVIGDKNSPGPAQSTGDPALSTVFESFGISQLFDGPTRGNNLLDVIFLHFDH